MQYWWSKLKQNEVRDGTTLWLLRLKITNFFSHGPKANSKNVHLICWEQGSNYTKAMEAIALVSLPMALVL